MGMGKTIMLSALIQTGLPTEKDITHEETTRKSVKQLRLNASFKAITRKNSDRPKPPSATLIVAPTSLLAQWAEELQRSSKKGTLDILVWHGTNRLDLDSMIDEDDEDEDAKGKNKKPLKVVITSYGTLASEHAKAEKHPSPIFESECILSVWLLSPVSPIWRLNI